MRTGALVRRILGATLLVTLGLVALPGSAEGHGTCSTSAQVQILAGHQVKAIGTRSCGSSHDSYYVYARVETFIGGSWQLLTSNSKNCGAGTSCTTNAGPANCLPGNSYRAYAHGNNTGHATTGATSNSKLCT